MMNNNKYYTFSLVLNGVSEITRELEDQVYTSGCDDAILYSHNGIVYLEFDRESTSLRNAIISAISDVEKIEDIVVSLVEPADYVTVAEIARRSDLSREYIRCLINGDRGPGDFPKPISGTRTKTLIYSWTIVSKWLTRFGALKDNNVHRTAFIYKIFNDALERRLVPWEEDIPLHLLKDLPKKVIKSPF